MIKAEVIADSKNFFGDRITTLLCVFPRFVLAEMNTHRIFSRNSASSRAIPLKRMLKMVGENPCVPVAWQKEHSGMQGSEYFTDVEASNRATTWLAARDQAITYASTFGELGVTKQLANRLLEPFMWHQALITSTEWNNFFDLRGSVYNWGRERNNVQTYRSKQDVLEGMVKEKINIEKIKDAPVEQWLKQNEGKAEIHMMLAAEAIWDAIVNSVPKELEPGEWHIPFGKNIDITRIAEQFPDQPLIPIAIKIATARCARTSYINYEGKDDYEADLDLFGSLVLRPYKDSKGRVFTDDDPIHASPAEHCARAMSPDEREAYSHTVPIYNKKGEVAGQEIEEGWCRNYCGFIQLRELIENKTF